MEKDLRKMRALLVGFELPHETTSLGSANFDAPKQFVSWIKDVPDSELAPISYGIIDAGLLGEYHQSSLGRGKVVLNHFIRSAEPEVRATVLLHELYHYWDLHVHPNPASGGEVYHVKSPQARARREYDAYMMAKRFWNHVRPSDVSSPSSRALDRIPNDSEELMRRVDALVLGRRNNQ